ncbi:MAG: metallophosphoesterase [Actinomycetaceae bacterium]|nr:metallophosphoesterase [Actinomycetaceae bacterium]
MSVKRLLRYSFAAGAAVGLYAFAQTRMFVVRHRVFRYDSGNLLQGAQGSSKKLRILHISDLHLLAHQKRKIQWVQSLAAHSPDFIVATGDFLSSVSALPALRQTLSVFTGIPGVFVYGSNDYYAPRAKNPFSYFGLSASMDEESYGALNKLPVDDLTDFLVGSLGWLNINNSRSYLKVSGVDIECVGVDDPHIERDCLPGDEERSKGNDIFRIGVAHAPYSRVLNSFVRKGCQMIFAGHTHGGQVRIPGVGALVTNCDMPTNLVSGTFEWPYRAGDVHEGNATIEVSRLVDYSGESAYVNVSAGLGTSPFAPVRLGVPPEAIIYDVYV